MTKLIAVVALVLALMPSTAKADPGWSAARPAACSVAVRGHAHCFAQVRGRAPGIRPDAAPPSGLGPAQIAAAYRLSGPTPAGALVAVVDAYDDPHAEADLAVYRHHFGLPPCTTANGCFRKVDQRGARTPLPEPDAGWAVEISLDLDAVSAACPSCSILLVEANTSQDNALARAVDTAVRLGARVVSNSYGIDEYAGGFALARDYRHDGVTMVVSSGDDGFGGPAPFPAVLGNVVAVGGTSLTRDSGTSRGWTERAWDGSGSGCSAYVAKPAWQHDGHCPMRTVADVSAVADAYSGFLAYDTYGLGSDAGYLQVGGTSLSAPLVAAMIARSGRPLTTARPLYEHRNALFDVRSGTNGYCGGDYLCQAKPGYDGPTGNGTPNGLAAL